MATSSPPAITTIMAPTTFFDLPAEIRNIIYRLAPRKTLLLLPQTRRQAPKTFALEASPFIYGPSTFTFATLFSGICFIRRIGRANAAHVTTLEMGTFWYKYAEAAALGFEYKLALGLTAQLLARRCPMLESLTVGDLSTEGPKRDWRVATLEFVKSLVDALPRLPNVSYNARWKELLLTVPERAVPSRYTVFDVDVEIKNRKDETKARRSAAGKKANAVKRAKEGVVKAS